MFNGTAMVQNSNLNPCQGIDSPAWLMDESCFASEKAKEADRTASYVGKAKGKRLLML